MFDDVNEAKDFLFEKNQTMHRKMIGYDSNQYDQSLDIIKDNKRINRYYETKCDFSNRSDKNIRNYNYCM